MGKMNHALVSQSLVEASSPAFPKGKFGPSAKGKYVFMNSPVLVILTVHFNVRKKYLKISRRADFASSSII
jgi:hypothetical protein